MKIDQSGNLTCRYHRNTVFLSNKKISEIAFGVEKTSQNVSLTENKLDSRKKKKQHSHFPMADDYTGSDNKLKGIDILKKKEKKSRRKSSSHMHSGDVKTDRPPLPKDNSI